jgi:hypothetical protein
MRQNSGLLTQHVSGTGMPIIKSTILSSAVWCPNRLGEITADLVAPQIAFQKLSLLIPNFQISATPA